jgi:phenylacetate-CoA ligase
MTSPYISAIHEKSDSSPLRKDPYVKKIYGLVHDSSLFNASPDKLESVRKALLRDALAYFSSHNPYYESLLESLDITPSSAELADLGKLAVPSDMLRGDGQKPFLIQDIDEGGETFHSSGTTGKLPVTIYRSPIDLDIMLKANTDLFEYVYGDTLTPGEGTALFMAAPELRDKLYFIASVHMTLENKGLDLIYGMDLAKEVDPKKPWLTLQPNKDNIKRFLKSKNGPKLFFANPGGVHLMSEKFATMGLVNKIAYKLAAGAPPVDLREGGLIITGGGSKGMALPPYGDIVTTAQKYFSSKARSGAARNVPFMDVLGMTETLTALIDRHGEMDKVPHPLSQAFLLDPRTMDVIEEDGKEGILGIFNPFVTSWLEVFYPGDLMSAHESDRYYGREFVYNRRLSVEEGWDLQRACGGTLEELMGNGAVGG